ncbi:MAG TPA: ABC transporter ATP-binding protein [Pyrinomonadaceae bacterium]|nr:ABC transporter ATP-binding protein [Pyrinomonadaceae bacterium]
MLEAKQISVGYGTCEVVSDISLEVKSGETLALLGANGAGKTTLLRALNGAIPKMSGEILLDGKLLENYSRREIARRIAVVAQEAELKFPVSVLEFVLGGRFAHGGAFGWENEQDLQAARNALQEADLSDFDKRFMNQLSGGERQRAVFARALATEANNFLLDEPTANLDLAHQVLLLRLVRQKCKQEGASAIVITHDLNLAAEFADKILLLKRGKPIAAGKPLEVLTEANLREVFGVKAILDSHPVSKNLRITPIYD